MTKSRRSFFVLAQQALGTTQAGLGESLGIARRTAQRWSKTGVPSYALPDVVKLVHPHDPALAGEIAAALGTTLEAMGAVAPAAKADSGPASRPRPATEAAAPVAQESSSAPAPALTAPPPPPLPDAVVGAVVCAAAEIMNLPPGEVRAGLHAAFACAKEIGLTIDAVERALRTKPRPR